jgi:hypothetical protein
MAFWPIVALYCSIVGIATTPTESTPNTEGKKTLLGDGQETRFGSNKNLPQCSAILSAQV